MSYSQIRRKGRALARLGSGCLTLLVAAPALAQEAVIPLEEIRLETRESVEGLALEAVPPSASRTGVAIREIPAAVDLIGAARIAERGHRTISEAVTQNVPGATSVASPAFGSAYALRGFQGNNSVTQLYDGARLFPGRGNVTFPSDVWMAEEIEVIHGGASVIHGSGAVGGAVNVTPKGPFSGPLRHQATIQGGEDKSFRLGYDGGGSLGERLSYRLLAVGDRSDGWIDGAEERSFALRGALSYQAAPDLKFTLSADRAEQKPMAYMGTPLRDGRIVKGTESLNYNVEDAENEFSDQWLQLRAEWTPRPELKLSGALYRMESERDFRNAETYLWDPATDLVSIDEFRRVAQEQEQTGGRAEIQLQHGLFGLPNRSAAGLEINRAESAYADASLYGTRLVDPFAPDPGRLPTLPALTPRYDSSLDQKAVFAENQTELGGGFALSLGGRYDWMDLERQDRVNAANSFSSDFRAPSARVGLSWTPVEAATFYGQFAWSTDPVNLPLLDYAASMRDFKLTTGRQFELGVKGSAFEGRAEWSLAAYDIEKRNVLVFDPGSFTTSQAGQQSSQGLELAAALRLTDGLKIGANAAFTRARFDEFTSIDWNTFSVVDYAGKRPLLTPEVSANLWGSWDFLPGWTLHAGAQFVGKSFYDYANATERDSFVLANLGLDWRPMEDVTLSLRATNVFDKTYAAYLRTDPATERAQAILGEPRRIELQLTKRF